MKKNNKKGFTIVELVIVIAVIGILAAVLIPTFGGVIEKANDSKVLQQLNSAYKEALAEAISDGKITEGEAGESVSVTVGSSQYTFVFKGTIDNYTCTVSGLPTGYTATYSNGAWTLN